MGLFDALTGMPGGAPWTAAACHPWRWQRSVCLAYKAIKSQQAATRRSNRGRNKVRPGARRRPRPMFLQSLGARWRSHGCEGWGWAAS